MKYFKISILFITTAFFITACNQSDSDGVSYSDPNGYQTEQSDLVYEEGTSVARENLDLQAVGELLAKADNAEEFEYLLNDPRNGINNLDLNGDGYADYISVREFDDRYDDERGFSLFSQFGPDEIQEIATIIFDRNGYNRNGSNYPGARVLMNGNEQIYGDNNYYETNWLEQSVSIVSWLFKDRNDSYRSPYYYENYPDYYETYEVVETPFYRTRIREYYPEPVFIQTNQPTITKIKIKSPYKDKSWNKIYAKLSKPTKDQFEFRKENPKPPKFDRVKKEKTKDVAVKYDKVEKENRKQFEKNQKFEKEDRKRFEKSEKFENKRPEMREKQNKPERVKSQKQDKPKFEKSNMKPQKQENKVQSKNNGKQNGGGKGKGKKP